ncbi:MAG: YbaK/EbsC family protein [Chloroflexales bacterium]|nr:YbaK/EbsC family protein [Chloroflexales bacterium]
MNTWPDRVLELLRDAAVPFEHLHHRTDYTAQEAAHDTHTHGRYVVKTVVLWVDGTLVLTLLPAPRVVNLHAVQEALGATVVRLATEAEIAARFPDCALGAIPPLGPLFDVPIYTSMDLADDELVTCTAGTLRDSVRLSYGDLRWLAGAVPLAFAEPAPQERTR